MVENQNGCKLSKYKIRRGLGMKEAKLKTLLITFFANKNDKIIDE